MFLVVLICLLSVSPSDYFKSNKRICMRLLPEMCVRPRMHQLNHGDYAQDYDQDPEYGLRSLFSAEV